MNLLALLLHSSLALANGGWVSSGGELFKDARNPWFVKNVKQVSWCLQMDSTALSVNEQQITDAFQDALAYWKDEFQRAAIMAPEGSFILGEQSFSKTVCTAANVDLRIVFGSSMLAKDELDYLKDPDKYVGVTVRTDYDPKNLRGHGFMFFSADVGTKAASPLPEKVWSRGKILRYALMHELGHVFGLPHVGGGLMSEIFLDQIMKPEYIKLFEDAPTESFLSPNPNFTACGLILTSANRQFFAVPPAHNCISMSRSNGGPFAFKLTSQPDKDSPSAETELGTLRLEQPDLQDFLSKPVSFLQLTEDQTVFTPKERAFRLFMIGPLANEFGTKGQFIPKTPGPAKQVYVRISPQGLNIVGTLSSGKISPVLQYNSPLGLIYMIPSQTNR